MSKEEEAPARLTRGALRRMSVDQEPTSAPGTPKKTAATSKKLTVLDAIKEGSNGPSDAEVDQSTSRTPKAKKDTSSVGNRSLRTEKKSQLNSTGIADLTVDNLEAFDNQQSLLPFPKRRPSQDQTLTPQTLPKRVTRRNSVTSEDGNLVTATPKASRTRHSIAAPAVILEDDEKEEQVNVSTAEADLSDLDIRKLRNRSISNSPVMRVTPSSRNTSVTSLKDEEVSNSPTKETCTNASITSLRDEGNINSPSKETCVAAVVEPKQPENDEVTEKPSNVDVETVTLEESNIVADVSSMIAKSPQRLHKDVKFDEGTPEQLNKTKYPKTPIAASGEKKRKLSEKNNDSLATVSDIIIVDETIKDSPQLADQQTEEPKTPTKLNETPKETIEDKVEDMKTEQVSLDKSIDASLVNIVEEVCENISKADESMSVLDTPKPKSQFTHLRENASSTPITTKRPPLNEIPEEEQKQETSTSESWSQAVKGSGKDKGIDVFSVRKQEEEEKQEEETHKLNESLKRKSLEMKFDSAEAKTDEESEDDEEEINVSQKRSSYVDDEAMEVEDYESGDSMDSETREEIENNKIEEHGETIGSQDTDSENDGEDGEDEDSWIASDAEEDDELLEGTGDDLDLEVTNNKHKGNKKRKRIIQQLDSSEDEDEKIKNQMEKTITKLDETSASQDRSPKKNDSLKCLDSSKNDSLKKSPASPRKSVGAKDSKLSQSREEVSVDKSEHSESVESASSPIAKESPAKYQDSPKSVKKSPSIVSPDVSELIKSPKKTPSRASLVAEPSDPKSALKHSSIVEANDVSDPTNPRKSLSAPVLISADFYSSSAKKRNTVNATVPNGEGVEEPVQEKPEQTNRQDRLSNLVTNPAALALAKKNKRLSQGLSPVVSKQDKRASLPGVFPVDKEVDSPLKRKADNKIEETEQEDAVEPMEVDDEEENEEEKVVEPSPKKSPVVKKIPKDLSEFNTDAILSRCNEIVRADKEKRKEGATLRQKKKDERRRKREQEQPDETAEGETDESPEQKKKKKKKKKVVNYLLEELGESKQDQVARALQRKLALVEVKRKRKKMKRAAKLRQQLNKENQLEETSVEGIAAKLEKKAKKAKKAENPVENLGLVDQQPVVKRAISAFAMYSEQIQDLKKAQLKKKKPKSKQLKDKNQQPSAAEEVQAALRIKSDSTVKEEKSSKHKHSKENSTDEIPSLGEHSMAGKKKNVSEKEDTAPEDDFVTEKRKKRPKSTSVDPIKVVVSDVPSLGEHSKRDKKKNVFENEDGAPEEHIVKEKHKKKHKSTSVDPIEAVVSEVSSLGEHSKRDKKKNVSENEDGTPGEQLVKEKHKKKHKSVSVDPIEAIVSEKNKLQQVNTAPLKSVVSLDDELAQLKMTLSDPITRVVKKQKLSRKESSTATATVREVTPPRKTTGKLKALSRLESGFLEEPVTPDHKLLKRNYGFQEEPVTPKAIHFKVSSVLPAGQEALKQEADAAKKRKISHPNSNRIRPEDVKEPVKGLPLPIWTKSGAFAVEELATNKSNKSSKKATDRGDYVPLSVNGAGSSSTEFLVKPLGGKGKREDKTSSGMVKAHRIDSATLDDAVVNFKKQAIFGKSSHLREKKPKL
ncbi:protein slender lobes-like [Armigeres subalbatus]|uniref:protein slender lobes-like n=1 Tax=Armigeres subalbatus TaxID=124917 RepID=UPI002ED40C71